MKGYRSVWDLFICCNHLLLVIPLRDLMLICALPWLSALCCLVLLLCFLLPCNPSFLRLFCVFSPSCLSLSALGFDCKTKTQTVVPINLHHWMSLSRWWPALCSRPSLACCDWWLRCLAWAVLCEREQFTPVWPSCRQASFLWEVFQWNPRRAFLGMTLPNLKRK